MAVLAVLTVVVIGTGAWLALARRTAPAPRPEPEAAPAPTASALGALKRRAGDPDALLVKAATRARAWHQRAELVAIRVSGLTEGRVDLDGGSRVELEFAPRTGRRPDDRSTTLERFLVQVDSSGEHVSEPKTASKAPFAPEPGCPFATAVRSGGVDPKQVSAVSYGWDTEQGRALWALTAGGKPIRLDGERCSVVANR